jgi:dynein heavy chain
LGEEAATTERRLSSAKKITDGLGVKKSRWEREKSSLGIDLTHLAGDCLIGATFLAYTGPFSCAERQRILRNTLTQNMIRCGLRFNQEPEGLDAFFVTDAVTHEWNAQGLPSDAHSIQNGSMTKYGKRFPLCIDPQLQAVSWIKKHHEGEHLTCKTLKDTDCMKCLELAVQYGNPFLLEKVEEELDPILDSILEQNVVVRDGQGTIIINGKVIEWNENFRLYLCTKLGNPIYTSEVMGKVTLINYAVTEDGLRDQLLSATVKNERPVRAS